MVQQCFLSLKSSSILNFLTAILNFCLNSLNVTEHQKVSNLLNETSDSKFVTRKWNIVNDQSKAKYDAEN